jgi:hypothetical protein
MTPTERVTNLANAISDGMNCVSHLRSLRAAPPLATAEDLEAWRDTLARCNAALEIVQGGAVDGLPLASSWRPSDDVVPAIEQVHACLSAITPGVELPPTLFDLADVAWTELTAAARP